MPAAATSIETCKRRANDARGGAWSCKKGRDHGCYSAMWRANWKTTIVLSLHSPFPKTDRNVRLECYEMWCWRMMEKINWIDRVQNEEVLHKVREEKTSYIE